MSIMRHENQRLLFIIIIMFIFGQMYKMYIWIVIVNVDFVLHDCCN